MHSKYDPKKFEKVFRDSPANLKVFVEQVVPELAHRPAYPADIPCFIEDGLVLRNLQGTGAYQ